MLELQRTASAINEQLKLSRERYTAVDRVAQQGYIIEDGVMTEAMISTMMVNQYNLAIDNVLSTTYNPPIGAAKVFEEASQQAIVKMKYAIDDLVMATEVLATVSAVAEMAAQADTQTERIEVQETLSTTDMSVDQQDVDNYNTAVKNVETYAQEAGAFLAASNSVDLTGAIDNFAAQNNILVSEYSALVYVQSQDVFAIEWFYGQEGSQEDYAIAVMGGFYDNVMTAEDLYAQKEYR